MSDFGKGFVYCFGLFLAHEGELRHLIPIVIENKNYEFSNWFSAACDHLREIQIPIEFDFMKNEINEFIEFSFGFQSLYYRAKGKIAKFEDVQKACEMAKNILLKVDEYLNIESEKGKWE